MISVDGVATAGTCRTYDWMATTVAPMVVAGGGAMTTQLVHVAFGWSTAAASWELYGRCEKKSNQQRVFSFYLLLFLLLWFLTKAETNAMTKPKLWKWHFLHAVVFYLWLQRFVFCCSFVFFVVLTVCAILCLQSVLWLTEFLCQSKHFYIFFYIFLNFFFIFFYCFFFRLLQFILLLSCFR